MSNTNYDLDDLLAGDDLLKPEVRKPVQPAQAQVEPPAPVAPASRATSLTGSAAIAVQAAAKLQQIEKEMNDLFQERENEVKSILIGLIAGRHVLLLGPPGTGKSALTYDLAGRILSANYFQILLNQTTDPSELLGPYSLTALQQDKFLRNSAGRLPEAHVAFLDEVYKGNSAALNVLLPLLNEGIWYNDGKPQPANLQFAVGASNEEPQDDSLGAFHDRFPLRHWVDYVRDSGNKAKMIRLNVERRNPQIAQARVKTTITLPEIVALRAKAQLVTVDAQVITTFQSLIFELEKAGIVVSDRRQAICFELAQANAVMEGRGHLLSDDFIVLIPVLWQRKDDFAKVETEVLKLANPFEEKVRRLISQARQVFDETMNTQTLSDKTNKAIDARDQLGKMEKTLDKTMKEAGAQGRDITKIQNARDEIRNMNNEIVTKCLLLNSNDSDSDDDMPF